MSVWFFMFIAFFFIMGPGARWRRRHWSRWDGEGRDGRDLRGESKATRELTEQLQRRDDQVEQLEARVNELESRLDFAERLLAPRRDHAVAPPMGSS